MWLSALDSLTKFLLFLWLFDEFCILFCGPLTEYVSYTILCQSLRFIFGGLTKIAYFSRSFVEIFVFFAAFLRNSRVFRDFFCRNLCLLNEIRILIVAIWPVSHFLHLLYKLCILLCGSWTEYVFMESFVNLRFFSAALTIFAIFRDLMSKFVFFAAFWQNSHAIYDLWSKFAYFQQSLDEIRVFISRFLRGHLAKFDFLSAIHFRNSFPPPPSK